MKGLKLIDSKIKDNEIVLDYKIIKDDFARAGNASSSIKKMLTQLGVSTNIIRKIAIITYEAEINIVIHSEGGNIKAIINPTLIEIIATDNGPGIENIDLALQAGYSTASPKIRELGFGAGMGLPNMKKYSDEFHIESDNATTVKMKIYL